MGKIKAFFRNKWVGFTLAALLYTLWFVVWTGNLWLLLGLPVIYDLYVSRLFYRYVWSRNRRMCERSKTYKAVYEWVNAIVFATVVAAEAASRGSAASRATTWWYSTFRRATRCCWKTRP